MEELEEINDDFDETDVALVIGGKLRCSFPRCVGLFFNQTKH